MAGAVQVRGLRKCYGQTRALDGATWGAEAGAVTAVLGPNGAGKTTSIECLVGLQRPEAGVALVLGADPWRSSAVHRARVGVMLQDGGLPTTVRARPLLEHLASLYTGSRDVDDLTARLGIGDFPRTTVRRMSGGQRQRVALAVALVGSPDVLFLDEPTAGLDPHARLDAWALVRSEADRGAAVVLTTHSFEEAERLADSIVIMAAGQVVAEGTPEQVGDGGRLEDVYFALTSRGPR